MSSTMKNGTACLTFAVVWVCASMLTPSGIQESFPINLVENQWGLPVMADDISPDAIESFLRAATWHGGLDDAEAILAAHPEIATGSIHAAATLGDDATVRRMLALDAENAKSRAAPYGANALVYLCLSNYLRLDNARSDGFVRTATALLDAGANPNSSFWSTGDYPDLESALYGAAGVAHNVDLTRLLLERGANPNDNEAVY